MTLSQKNLNVTKEAVYFTVLLLLSLGVWAGVPYWLFISKNLQAIWFFIPIGVLLAFLIWLGDGLLTAYLRSNCIKIDATQLPKLQTALEEVCKRLEVQVPELYVLQSHGFLNAFAMRHSGRNFVVLYSKLIEELDLVGDEVRFILGHEIGHLRSKHILKQILLMPSAWLPLIGPAYHRACETSCDRYGAYVVENMDGAVKALAILASGQKLVADINIISFAEQYQKSRGFFVSWYELISNYPSLSQRVGAIIAIQKGVVQKPGFRNPFSYIFALFSFGQGSHGTTPFMTIAIISLLAAIAIPNLLIARRTSNDALAKATIKAISTACDTYAETNNGNYPRAESDLNNAHPPYLNHSYCGKTIAGFIYNCEFSSSFYDIMATPVVKGETGSETFSIVSSAKPIQPNNNQLVQTKDIPVKKEIDQAKVKTLKELGLSTDERFDMNYNNSRKFGSK